MRVADPAVGQWATGFHRDLPEQHFAQLVEELPDKVGFADRYATGGDDHIGASRGGNKGALEFLGNVRYDTHVDHVAVQSRQHSIEGVAIAVVDLARRKRGADRFQFVAGGKKCDAQFAKHRHLADTQ